MPGIPTEGRFLGQKVNPIGFRTGGFYDWKSHWLANKSEFREQLIADLKLRRILFLRLKNAGVTDVVIDRLPKSMMVRIFVTRPGMVIGRGGSGIEELKEFIRKTLGLSKAFKLDVPIEEVSTPELSAHLVAVRIVGELERGLPARRVITKVIDRVMAGGASGIKVVISGRIGGAEISRRQRFQIGSVPAQTLRANIDYAQIPALLKRGYVGVKVWIHKKET